MAATHAARLARHLLARTCCLCIFAQYRDPILQRSQANPQHFSGQFAIAVHVIERELDVSLFEFREWLARLEHRRTLMAG